jgi:hypothetical protein
LVWEPLAGDWDGGWECIFVHEWAFLAGAWAGVFWTWAGQHYLEIDPRMREMTWVGG